MAAVLPPMPTASDLEEQDPQTKRPSGRISKDWYLWFYQLVTRIQASAQSSTSAVSLTTQAASIAATGIPLTNLLTGGTIQGGLYRISWYARITQAATTSSSLTVTIGWQESGNSLTTSGAALTGNTTTTDQSGSVLVRNDPGGVLSYATTYSSTGVTPMQYRLDVVAELVL